MPMKALTLLLICCIAASGLVYAATGQAVPTAVSRRRAEQVFTRSRRPSRLSVQRHAAGRGATQRPPEQPKAQGVTVAVRAQPEGACSQGDIKYIKCWLDEEGFVTGVAFDHAEGKTSPDLCYTEGPHQEGGFLYDGETILEIISCRGPEGGITHLEFHTDGNRIHPISCGRASQQPFTTEHFGEEVERQEWCESLTQGYYTPQGAYEISKTGPRRSYNVEYGFTEIYPLGGLTARCSQQGIITSFKNTCWDSEDAAPNVHSPVLVEAWIKLNDGPPEEVKNPVHQEECVPDMCSESHTARQLSAWTATALPHLLQEVGCKDVWVKHSVLSCKPCGRTSGTTLQVALALYAQKGGLETLEHTMRSMLAWPERNLCKHKNIVIGCEQEGVSMLRLANVWVQATKAPQLMLT